MAEATITGLFVHPIKGARGIAVQRALFAKTGLKWDRQFALVRADPETNGAHKFISQRTHPALALVEPALPEDDDALDAVLTVTAPAAPAPLRVPLQPPTTPRRIVVQVWDFVGTVHDEGDEAAAWFSAVLGLPLRLVRYIGTDDAEFVPSHEALPGAVRTTNPDFATGYEINLSDGFPLLLANEASMADLNERLAASDSPEAALAPLSIRRFRPNIVVAGPGLTAWAEERWRDIKVERVAGGANLKLTAVKPCGRCTVPTIDPETGVKSQGEPSDIMATFRTGNVLNWKAKMFKHLVHFGFNLVHEQEAVGQTISVGDKLVFSTPQRDW